MLFSCVIIVYQINNSSPAIYLESVWKGFARQQEDCFFKRSQPSNAIVGNLTLEKRKLFQRLTITSPIKTSVVSVTVVFIKRGAIVGFVLSKIAICLVPFYNVHSHAFFSSCSGM